MGIEFSEVAAVHAFCARDGQFDPEGLLHGEFPADPANTAGFDNSGETLVMSPTLLNKYLQAAHEIANHLFLTRPGPDGVPVIAAYVRPSDARVMTALTVPVTVPAFPSLASMSTSAAQVPIAMFLIWVNLY